MLSAGGQTAAESRNKGKCLYQECLGVLDTGIIFLIAPRVLGTFSACWKHTAPECQYKRLTFEALISTRRGVRAGDK